MTFPAIAPGEAHVWWCDLRGSAAAKISAWAARLDPSERDRAARFRFEEDRVRWAAGRGALRELAARYLGASPGELRFEYGPAGKPQLPDAPIRFNLSRSKDAVLIAFASSGEIGADVERVRAGYDGADIAGRFFAPGEAASLAALPEGTRSEAFFRVWTAKEAYLKGRGEGLGFPLDAFEVSVEGHGPRRLRAHRDAGEIARWWLVPLSPAPRWAAALAVTGEPPLVRFFDAGRP
jgi:4'-phosphopantetheinyl transferase